MNALLAILWKDLVSEWRSRDRVVAMAALLVAGGDRVPLRAARRGPGEARRLAPGLLWVAYVFAALLGLNRAFALELENDALSALALAPADRGWIFLGKAAANFVLLGVVQAPPRWCSRWSSTLDLVPVAAPLAGVVALGSLGLCAVGTLFSAVAVRTRFREVMLPLLLLPLLVPVLLGAVRATAALLAGRGRPAFEPVQLLLVTDAVFLIVSFLGFDYVLDESERACPSAPDDGDPGLCDRSRRTRARVADRHRCSPCSRARGSRPSRARRSMRCRA